MASIAKEEKPRAHRSFELECEEMEDADAAKDLLQAELEKKEKKKDAPKPRVSRFAVTDAQRKETAERRAKEAAERIAKDAAIADIEEIVIPSPTTTTTEEILVTTTNDDGTTTEKVQRTITITASDGTVTTKSDSKPVGGEYGTTITAINGIVVPVEKKTDVFVMPPIGADGIPMFGVKSSVVSHADAPPLEEVRTYSSTTTTTTTKKKDIFVMPPMPVFGAKISLTAAQQAMLDAPPLEEVSTYSTTTPTTTTLK